MQNNRVIRKENLIKTNLTGSSFEYVCILFTNEDVKEVVRLTAAKEIYNRIHNNQADFGILSLDTVCLLAKNNNQEFKIRELAKKELVNRLTTNKKDEIELANALDLRKSKIRELKKSPKTKYSFSAK